MSVVQSVPTPAPAATSGVPAKAVEKDDGFSFDDFLDIVNPLQHIPVISYLYRKLTGDEIRTPAKLAGDTLYGGPIGLISSIADTVFESATGKSFADTAFALFSGSDSEVRVATGVAPAELSLNAPAIAVSEAAPRSEAGITAALNRAQLERAVTARVAYARANGLAGAGVIAASP